MYYVLSWLILKSHIITIILWIITGRFILKSLAGYYINMSDPKNKIEKKHKTAFKIGMALAFVALLTPNLKEIMIIVGAGKVVTSIENSSRIDKIENKALDGLDKWLDSK
jgi:hypothetical protein